MSQPSFQAALSNTVVNLASRSGRFVGVSAGNPNAALVYLQFFSQLAANVTLGTTVPYMTLVLPASAPLNLILAQPDGYVPFSGALSVAATTTPTGNTGPGSAIPCTFFLV